MPLISIVVPCYNEQESLPIFLKELDGVVRIMTQQDPEISFEAVLIDDGSADKTLAVMKAEAAAAHPYAIRWHSFSRNFGAYRTKCVSTLGVSAQVDAPFSAV